MSRSPRVIGIVQARVGSTRLPGKVLHEIGGRPLLSHVIERARRAGRLDAVWIATSVAAADNPIAALATAEGCGLHRGSEADVLQRYVEAAQVAEADIIVRLTGDNPLVEPAYIRLATDHHLAAAPDLTCLKDPEQIVPGTGCEVISAAALRTAAAEGRAPEDREHVTWYLLAHRDRFRIDFPAPPPRWRNPGIRLTVDEPEDLELVRRIYARLGLAQGDFGLAEVLDLYAREPRMFAGNAQVHARPNLFRPGGCLEVLEGPTAS